MGTLSVLGGERLADIEWTTWSGESNEKINGWLGGRVDVNIFNNCTEPLDVRHKVSFSTTEEPILEHVLMPGTGVRFVSHEREEWAMFAPNGDIKGLWTIDIGNGILQDLIVQ